MRSLLSLHFKNEKYVTVDWSIDEGINGQWKLCLAQSAHCLRDSRARFWGWFRLLSPPRTLSSKLSRFLFFPSSQRCPKRYRTYISGVGNSAAAALALSETHLMQHYHCLGQRLVGISAVSDSAKSHKNFAKKIQRSLRQCNVSIYFRQRCETVTKMSNKLSTVYDNANATPQGRCKCDSVESSS